MMEIKIGFTDNPRELVINAKGKKEEITNQINDALSKPTDASAVLAIDDAKGHTHLIRRAAIAYVEIGSESARPVGFA
ncbi:DUF3107 domain-containing protein [Corynebacterium pseudokroppenstedtii]